MKSLLRVLLAAIGLAGLLGCSKSKAPEVATSDQFALGQVWEYKSRAEEADSRVIVGRIEHVDKVGTVIHVKLTGLKIKNPDAPGGLSDTMSHLPITETKLKESVIRLLGENGDLEGFQKGYDIWLKSHRAGDAGVFTITLAEIVDFMEEGIEKGRRSP